jgi:hypothetical protein
MTVYWEARVRDIQPYVDLALAILRQAVTDAAGGDREALAFLRSPQAGHLLDCFGIPPGYCQRLLARLPSPAAPGAEPGLVHWVSVARASALTGYNQEYIRQRVRAGQVEAVKGKGGWLVNLASLSSYQDEVHGLGEIGRKRRRNQ